MKHAKPFAEIVAEVRFRTTAAPEVRPGAYNRAGELFDPAGRLLTRAREITAAEARELVRDGAQLAFEGCGCGGGGGCTPTWIGEAERRALATATAPRFVRGFGSPTWIDLWRGDDDVSVVYAHGDVAWGDALV